jgi:hypothetical protein
MTLPNLFPKIELPNYDLGGFDFTPRGALDKKKMELGEWPPEFDDYQHWLRLVFPKYIKAGFADRHNHLWGWVDGIRPGIRSRPFAAFWPRGGAKSTTAELACVRLGAKGARRYVWYVSSTQDKADKHVENIGAMLESAEVERYHPAMASRAVGKYGASRGWRRSRLRTASGFTVDAFGLDGGVRGAKVEDQRPDLIIIDDVDDKHDSMQIIKKKLETLTSDVLPAGSSDLCVLFIQNVIHSDSIAAMLLDGRTDALADKIISGPFPAIEGLVTTLEGGRYVITGGIPTWDGQGLDVCQKQIYTWGFTAFRNEAQHEVDREGGIWDHIVFRHATLAECPHFERVTVWVDPAVTSTDNSDSQGIQVDALGEDGIIYRLFSWEAVMSPESAVQRAIKAAIEYNSPTVGIETDQGGDTWESVFERASDKIRLTSPMLELPTYKSDKAGAGHGSKVARNALMLTDYERGLVVHVTDGGYHVPLEKALKRFPLAPKDLADAAYWSWQDLRESGSGFSMDYLTMKHRRGK